MSTQRVKTEPHFNVISPRELLMHFTVAPSKYVLMTSTKLF